MKIRPLLVVGVAAFAVSILIRAEDSTCACCDAKAQLLDDSSDYVMAADRVTLPLHTQAVFTDIDASIESGDYKKAYRQMKAAFDVYPPTYSLEWLNTMQDKFFVAYEGFVSKARPSLFNTSMNDVDYVARHIADAYSDRFNEHALAIKFLETFFFESLHPEELVDVLLRAHDKNGSLKEGCDFVWRYIVALANQDSSGDLFSAMSLMQAPEIACSFLDFCIKVDPAMTVVFGKDFVEHAFNDPCHKNHLKNVVTGVENLLKPLLDQLEEIFQNQHKNIKPLSGDCYNQGPLNALCFPVKSIGPCCELIYNNKQFFAKNSPALISDAKDYIVARLLADFTVVCIKTARAMQEIGHMEEARNFLRDVYNKYKACGFVKAAEGLKAYAQACPQSYQESDEFEEEYGIYVGCPYGAPETLRFLKKDTFSF